MAARAVCAARPPAGKRASDGAGLRRSRLCGGEAVCADAVDHARRHHWARRRPTPNRTSTVARPLSFVFDLYSYFDLYKSQPYDESAMKAKTIRTSLDIPADLHERIHAAARRRGCSARQLILSYLDRLATEENAATGRRVEGPLVPADGRGVIRDATNDEALFA